MLDSKQGSLNKTPRRISTWFEIVESGYLGQGERN